MRESGPEHPIVVAPHGKRVRVVARGVVVAETAAALALMEARYAPVLYIPREDTRWQYFIANPRRTTCPYKGEASYYDLRLGDATLDAAVWSYEHPFPAVAQIEGHLAFYPNKIDGIEEIAG